MDFALGWICGVVFTLFMAWFSMKWEWKRYRQTEQTVSELKLNHDWMIREIERMRDKEQERGEA